MPPVKTVELHHELFCLPRPDQEEPRIERFTSYRDFGGRAVPVTVIRCIECGTFRTLDT